MRIEIERVHLEEDTGKSLHVGGSTGRIHGATHSLVDYNRAGIPLVEIVTKPVTGTGARPAEVAKAYVTELRDVLRGLGVSDVRMEQGSLRCDVNVSLNQPGEEWGTRSETKNVNSLRSVERAVRSEVERQAGRLRAGERIVQETRHFHEDTGMSTSGRSKEEATDYRYFPEPDLVPVAPDPAWVEELKARAARGAVGAPQAADRPSSACPSSTARRWSTPACSTSCSRPSRPGAPAAEARNWWLGHARAGAPTRAASTPAELPITPEQVARVVALVAEGSAHRRAWPARSSTACSPARASRTRSSRRAGSRSSPTRARSATAVDEAIAAQPDVADKVRGGKVQAVGALVGAVMKATRGQADAVRRPPAAARAPRRRGLTGARRRRPADDLVAAPRRTGWLAWPLLALSLLRGRWRSRSVARRVLTGKSQLFGEIPQDLPFRDARLAAAAASPPSRSCSLAPAARRWPRCVWSWRVRQRRDRRRAPRCRCGAAVAVAAAVLRRCAASRSSATSRSPSRRPRATSASSAAPSRCSSSSAARAAATLLIGVLAGGLARAAGRARPAARRPSEPPLGERRRSREPPSPARSPSPRPTPRRTSTTRTPATAGPPEREPPQAGVDRCRSTGAGSAASTGSGSDSRVAPSASMLSSISPAGRRGRPPGAGGGRAGSR